MRPPYLRMLGSALLVPSLLLLSIGAGHAPAASASALRHTTAPTDEPLALDHVRSPRPETPGPAAPTPAASPAPMAKPNPVPNPPPAPKPSPVASALPALQSQVGQLPGTYGIYLQDLTTGEAVGIGQDAPFPAASTFKLPMAIHILQQVDQGQVTLEDRLVLTAEDWEDGTGVLQEEPAGQAISIGHLLDLAITESDNIATNMLLRRFGRPNVWALEERLGGRHTHDNQGINITSAVDLATYVRAVLDPQVLSAQSRDRLLTALQHTDFPIRIQAGVPVGVPVAHKIGTLPDITNDIGLVQFPDHPYILAICSKGLGEEEGDDALAAISRTVYNLYQQAWTAVPHP